MSHPCCPTTNRNDILQKEGNQPIFFKAKQTTTTNTQAKVLVPEKRQIVRTPTCRSCSPLPQHRPTKCRESPAFVRSDLERKSLRQSSPSCGLWDINNRKRHLNQVSRACWISRTRFLRTSEIRSAVSAASNLLWIILAYVRVTPKNPSTPFHTCNHEIEKSTWVSEVPDPHRPWPLERSFMTLKTHTQTFPQNIPTDNGPRNTRCGSSTEVKSGAFYLRKILCWCFYRLSFAALTLSEKRQNQTYGR